MKLKKKILTTILLLTVFMLSPVGVLAAGNQALLVGRDYGGIDTSIDVTNAQSGLGPLAFTYQANTNPTIGN